MGREKKKHQINQFNRKAENPEYILNGLDLGADLANSANKATTKFAEGVDSAIQLVDEWLDKGENKNKLLAISLNRQKKFLKGAKNSFQPFLNSKVADFLEGFGSFVSFVLVAIKLHRIRLKLQEKWARWKGVPALSEFSKEELESLKQQVASQDDQPRTSRTPSKKLIRKIQSIDYSNEGLFPHKEVRFAPSEIDQLKTFLHEIGQQDLSNKVNSYSFIKNLTPGLSFFFGVYEFALNTIKASVVGALLVVLFPKFLSAIGIAVTLPAKVAGMFELLSTPLGMLITGLTLVFTFKDFIKTLVKYLSLRASKSALNKKLNKQFFSDEVDFNWGEKNTLKEVVALLRGEVFSNCAPDIKAKIKIFDKEGGNLTAQDDAITTLREFFFVRQHYLRLKNELIEAGFDPKKIAGSEYNSITNSFEAKKNITTEQLQYFHRLSENYRAKKSILRQGNNFGERGLKILISSVEQRESLLKSKLLDRWFGTFIKGISFALLVANPSSPVIIGIAVSILFVWNVLDNWEKLPFTKGPILPWKGWGKRKLNIGLPYEDGKNSKMQNYMNPSLSWYQKIPGYFLKAVGFLSIGKDFNELLESFKKLVKGDYIFQNFLKGAGVKVLSTSIAIAGFFISFVKTVTKGIQLKKIINQFQKREEGESAFINGLYGVAAALYKAFSLFLSALQTIGLAGLSVVGIASFIPKGIVSASAVLKFITGPMASVLGSGVLGIVFVSAFHKFHKALNQYLYQRRVEKGIREFFSNDEKGDHLSVDNLKDFVKKLRGEISLNDLNDNEVRDGEKSDKNQISRAFGGLSIYDLRKFFEARDKYFSLKKALIKRGVDFEKLLADIDPEKPNSKTRGIYSPEREFLRWEFKGADSSDVLITDFINAFVEYDKKLKRTCAASLGGTGYDLDFFIDLVEGKRSRLGWKVFKRGITLTLAAIGFSLFVAAALTPVGIIPAAVTFVVPAVMFAWGFLKEASFLPWNKEYGEDRVAAVSTEEYFKSSYESYLKCNATNLGVRWKNEAGEYYIQQDPAEENRGGVEAEIDQNPDGEPGLDALAPKINFFAELPLLNLYGEEGPLEEERVEGQPGVA